MLETGKGRMGLRVSRKTRLDVTALFMGRTRLIDVIRAARLYGFATRHCGKTVRRWVFDQMYASAKWNFDDRSPELISAVEDYSSGGAILILGCGNASLIKHLKPDTFQYVLGIDISPQAILMAKRHADEKVQFEVADIREYQCARRFDVILFSESLYYIRPIEQESILKRFCSHLTPKGCIIVTVVNPNGYQDIIQMIRTNFTVLREAHFEETDRFLLVFR
jgi:SAM-dependent methyltransferase